MTSSKQTHLPAVFLGLSSRQPLLGPFSQNNLFYGIWLCPSRLEVDLQVVPMKDEDEIDETEYTIEEIRKDGKTTLERRKDW